MSLAAQIRSIQTSESTKQDKIRKCSKLFDDCEKSLGIEGEWLGFFTLMKTAVCDNIHTHTSIIPLATKVPKYANKFAYLFGFNVVQGQSSVFYLSWSKPLMEKNTSVGASIVFLLKEAAQTNTLLDEFIILRSMVPKKDLQLFVGTYSKAPLHSFGRRVETIVEEKPFECDGIYLFIN